MEEIDNKCRFCKQHEETIDHLTSRCSILVKNEYLMRHDKVCAHLHYSICKALGIEMTHKWYTDREVTAKRPDIIKKKRENMHTDRCGNTLTQ
jgi:hypothetical protein